MKKIKLLAKVDSHFMGLRFIFSFGTRNKLVRDYIRENLKIVILCSLNEENLLD